MSSSPSSSAGPAKVPSEDILAQKTDLCLSNGIVKAGMGLGAGVVLSVILFKRRPWPVFLGLGFGLGSAYSDCERAFNPTAIPGVRVLRDQEREQLSGRIGGGAAAPPAAPLAAPSAAPSPSPEKRI